MLSLKRARFRLKFALWSAALLGGGILLYFILNYFLLKALLYKVKDDRLHLDVNLVASTLGREGPQSPESLSSAALTIQGGAQLWVEVHTADGAIIWAAYPPESSLRRMPDAPPHSAAGEPFTMQLRGQAEPALRYLWEMRQIPGIGPVRIQAARGLEPITSELHSFAISNAITLPIAALITGVIAFMVGGFMLTPLKRIAAQLKKLTPNKLGVEVDVSEKDEMGQLALVLNETLGRLHETFERLKRFTGDVSHELRTPLTALRTRGELALRSAKTREELRESVSDMLETTDGMIQLVEDMLFMARADRGELALRFERVDVRGVLAEAIEFLGALADENGVRLVLDAPEELPVSTDPAFLRQAVVNLLHNAIKFSPAGGAVRVRGRRTGPTVLLEVEDNGPGIAPEHLDKVFDRFYRIDDHRARISGGMGLGLSLSRWIVRAFGGDILVRSTPGRGSTFTIRLQYSPPA